MSHKHRRPSAISRIGRRPLHLGVAAGVAGTVAMTGTLVASAAPTAPARNSIKTSPAAFIDTLTVTDERSSQRAADQAGDLVRRQRAAAAARVRAAKIAAAKRAALQAAAKRRAAEARKKRTAARSTRASDERMSASAAHVLSIAAAQSGDRYSYGGNGPDAFDCSGFTQYVFGKVGISLPHSSSAQYSVARHISASQVRPGDLVFVHNGGGGSIGHVAIYAGNGWWYEASNPSTGVGKHRAWSSNVSYGRVL